MNLNGRRKIIVSNYYQKFIKKNAKVTHKKTYEGLLVQCNCVNEDFCLKDKDECHHFEPHICDEDCNMTYCYDNNLKKHYGVKCLPVKEHVEQ